RLPPGPRRPGQAPAAPRLLRPARLPQATRGLGVVAGATGTGGPVPPEPGGARPAGDDGQPVRGPCQGPPARGAAAALAHPLGRPGLGRLIGLPPQGRPDKPVAACRSAPTATGSEATVAE